jgi:hypothetical protein
MGWVYATTRSVKGTSMARSRRGGKVNIKGVGRLAPSTRAAIHAEAASMPIPGKAVTVSLTEH